MNDARMIRAMGHGFTNVLRAAQGLPPLPDPDPSMTARLRRYVEERRLHTAAINRRMAELEAEVSAATDDTEATDNIPSRWAPGGRWPSFDEARNSRKGRR